MIKKLFFTAALLVPVVAYAANPSAPFSGQVVPAAPPPPPPNGIACTYGPNYTGSVPAAASAAWGANTTCAFNSDFRQPFFANLANWFDCGGASQPMWWNSNYGASTFAPCSDTAIETDTDGAAVQVLHQKVTVADLSNGVLNNSIITSSSDQLRQINFPFAIYWESRYRLSASTMNSCGISFCGYFDTFTFSNPGQTAAFYEKDFDEIYSDSSSIGGGGVGWGGATSPGWGQPPTFSSVSGYNPAQYNTYGVRFTTDGNGNVGVCTYLNGRQLGCATGTGDTPLSAFAVHTKMLNVVGTVNDPNPAEMTAQRDVYTEYVTVWTCAGWQTNNCYGSILSGPP